MSWHIKNNCQNPKTTPMASPSPLYAMITPPIIAPIIYHRHPMSSLSVCVGFGFLVSFVCSGFVSVFTWYFFSFSFHKFSYHSSKSPLYFVFAMIILLLLLSANIQTIPERVKKIAPETECFFRPGAVVLFTYLCQSTRSTSCIKMKSSPVLCSSLNLSMSSSVHIFPSVRFRMYSMTSSFLWKYSVSHIDPPQQSAT